MADAGCRPNVLLICTDHWSGLLTRPAGHPVVMMPTVEQLSRNGVIARRAMVTPKGMGNQRGLRFP